MTPSAAAPPPSSPTTASVALGEQRALGVAALAVVGEDGGGAAAEGIVGRQRLAVQNVRNLLGAERRRRHGAALGEEVGGGVESADGRTLRVLRRRGGAADEGGFVWRVEVAEALDEAVGEEGQVARAVGRLALVVGLHRLVSSLVESMGD